ncbi:MAG: NADH-quinone oxidoreductase subunit J [Thermodesulfobacteriota bacterium]|nr:NADH-quinone oxidoreductase subunit J [Thermodesulfobacteriota bacterium]
MEILFYIFAAITIVSSFMVIIQKHTVRSALFLVVAFFFMGAIYILMEAEFVAVIQVMVYAGAIMVLFLFVIMLLNLQEESVLRERKKGFGKVLGSVGAILLFAVLYVLISSITYLKGIKGDFSPEKIASLGGNTVSIASKLFTDYLLPFEITSILLLVAIIGAVILTKSQL